MCKFRYVLLAAILLLIPAGCGSKSDTPVPSATATAAATPTATPVAVPAPTPSPAPVPTPTPAPTPTPKAVNGVSLPILYYHAVNDATWGIEELFVKQADFDAQMAWLSKQGYTPVSFDDFPKLSTISKPVLITFDDGYSDNATVVYPILKKYNLKATVFLTTGFGGERYLSHDQIRAMTDRVTFEAHSVTHPEDIRKIPADQLKKELAEPVETIRGLTGRAPVAFAYPVGLYNDQVVKETSKYYQYAVENGGGYSRNDPALHLKRIYVKRNEDLNTFIRNMGAGGSK